MEPYDTIYDISVLLGEESIDYPGDTPYSKELISTIKDGAAFDLSKLIMSAHSGTHIDSPSHFILNSKSIDQYAVIDFILPAHVADIKDKESIQTAELENLEIEPGDALLFKTDNSLSGRSANGVFLERFVYLTPEAADYCAEKKVRLVGVDYISIEKYGDEAFPSHRKLLRNDILILEGINLKKVPRGKYRLICLPLRIKRGEASPVRAVLIR